MNFLEKKIWIIFLYEMFFFLLDCFPTQYQLVNEKEIFFFFFFFHQEEKF